MKNAKHNILIRYRNYLIILMLFAMTLVAETVQAQKIHKKNLTEKEYSLWATLALEAISDDGQWVSYRKYYEATDTLFVTHRKSKQRFAFKQPYEGSFKSKYYVCGTRDGVLRIVSLESGKVKELKGVQKFTLYNSFIILEKVVAEQTSTSIINYEGLELYADTTIIEYDVSPNEKRIAISTIREGRNGVKLLATKDFGTHTICQQSGEQGFFERLKWSADSNALAFTHFKDAASTVYCYNIKNTTLKTFSTASEPFPSAMNVDPNRTLKISEDGSRVFFVIRQRKELNVVRKPNEVQVWKSNDKDIYPSSIASENYTQNPRQAMWEPESGHLLVVTDAVHPKGAPAGNHNMALTYNPLQYGLADKFVSDNDYYAVNFTTGKSTLVAQQVVGAEANIMVSPKGNYVSYFDKGAWKVYAVATGNTTIITKNVPVSFSVESLNEKDEMGYGAPGWSEKEEFMLVYDQYDIWKIKPDGSSATRLTKGREKGVKYRLIPEKRSQQQQYYFTINTNGTYDLNADLLLSTRSVENDYNGFSLLRNGTTVRDICYVRKNISSIARSTNGIYVWSEEDAVQSPSLITQQGTEQPQVLATSNEQQQDFYWTKAELISYTNSKGEALKGILYYPAGYESGKLYPMVVNIYEKQSQFMHSYTNPTLFNGDGFNKTNLTSQGYFVLLPDITYAVGDIGASAVDCVEAAVGKALENKSIDKDNIGLIGHSFGGTQTDFIITQSTLFKCAVAGAATTDFLSSYLSVTPNYKIPNFFKIEDGQARMLVSPFENFEIYFKNSAVFHAATITTPLLSWTGLRDGQVDYTQSFEFYLALRKLKKEHTMLVYPDVEHDMSGRTEGADLTAKVEEWFDYHLKGGTMPKWL